MELLKIGFTKSEISISPIVRQVWRITKAIIPEIFNVSLLWFLILYEIEDFIPGFVTLSFEVDILFGIVVATGFITLILRDRRDRARVVRRKHLRRCIDIVFIVLLAFAGGGLIFSKIMALGSLTLPVSILSGLIILLISLIILSEDE